MPTSKKEGIYRKLEKDLDKLQDQDPTLKNAGGQHFPDTVDYFRPPIPGIGGIADGTFRLFDVDNPDDALMDAVEQEAIAISSAPMRLFRLNRKRTTVDRVTGESQIRFYHKPVTVVGNYEAPTPEQQLSRFGIQEAEEIEMIFSINYLMRDCGGQIMEGDVIMTYDGKLWEVIDSVIDSEALWTKGHNRLALKRVFGEGYLIPDPKNPEKFIDISDTPNQGSKSGHHEKGEDPDGGFEDKEPH